MLKIGLTGGIGSGKSTVAARMSHLGALVVDADAVAREVVAPGTHGLAAVVERFGPDVLGEDGGLDRGALASRVFADPSARADLEAITHPLVAARTAELMASVPADRIVVYDVPLLVEKRLGAAYHLVVVTDATRTIRAKRLQQRGMTEADARARMAHQATPEQRRAAADVVLDNNGTPDQLLESVDALWRDRLVPYDENLRAGRRHRRSDVPILSDYDEDWPHAAERAIGRISLALGERAPEIEHVGSTAVPGLPARDVIDIQIGVPQLKDADDPEFVRLLTELGFPRSEGNCMDQPKGQMPDPELWIKRFHGSSDPGRVVHLHIREMGSAGWQYALLYRDWLRSDADARADYLTMKQQLVESCADNDEYRSKKEPWFDEIWPRMLAWAKRTGWHD